MPAFFLQTDVINFLIIFFRENSVEKSKSLIKSGKDEGLNTVIYQINRIELTYLFTRYYISYNETEILLSYDFKLS